MNSIDPRLVLVALNNVDTYAFEKFGQIFYGALQDREFVPLGGMHDGGAEGFDVSEAFDPEVYFENNTSNFLQISKQETIRKKVRETVRRLREYGRKPKVLTYLSSQIIPRIDKQEEELSSELGCMIRIRDASFIENNINRDRTIQAAFHAYLEPSIEYLYKPGTADIATQTEEYVDRTLAVFLRQEVDNRRDKTGLLEAVADSLILWALGDTDPDKQIFMKRDEILNLIEETLPSARKFIRGVIDDRLEKLVSKEALGGRQIRRYNREEKYCLPYETRQLVAAENAEDDLLKQQVSEIFEIRVKECATADEEDISHILNKIIQTIHSTLERVFEKQGLQMAQFITDADIDDDFFTDVSQIVSSEVDKLECAPREKGLIRRYCLLSLRGTLYKGKDVERIYLQKLSRTYILLLTIKNEPKIVEYFRSLAKTFKLYIGTDFFIRIISEQYLNIEDRTTSNLLDILKLSGAELILTEKVIEEIETHLRAQILEFENHYAMVESKISLELVAHIDRILIRAYFYSKISPADGIPSPANWRDYIGQFANFGDVKARKASSQLAGYFMRRYNMTYETTEEMEKGIDQEELDILARKIYEAKGGENNLKNEGYLLAYNDALHILRIFQKRIECKETTPGNQWGYQTWWLTQDSKVRRAGVIASAKRGGAHFMMRPEFLLSNISFAPELKAVRDSYEKIFPSVLGVRLSSRLDQSVFDNVMKEARQIAKYDDARAGTLITDLTNRLKSDALRAYEINWSEQF